jgi:chloramphenicol-sensitive protein RarD
MLDTKTKQGVYFGLSAYLFWGIAPIYFKWISHVSPWEILTHRVIWALVLLLLILAYTGELHKLKIPLDKLPYLAVSSVLLSLNWLIFIYAVVNNNIVEASLGYFINPLVSVFLGVLFLQERLRPLQWIAIAIAGAGITFQLILFGEVPWIALALAFSFGLYGLIRKQLELHAIVGLTLETAILAPFGLTYLIWTYQNQTLTFGTNISTDLLLILGGLVTSFPLLCFAAAITRLSLTTMGMLQYIAPTLSLLLALFVYGEIFDISKMISFGCIWLALIVFTLEAGVRHRRAASISKSKS